MSKFSVQPVKFPKLRTAGLSSVKGAMFGMTRNGGTRAHQGIDLAVEPGYKCYAVENGTVMSVAVAASGYGMVVTVKLDCPSKTDLNGRFVFYAHLSTIKVKAGQKIKAGDVIGLSGDTGNAAGMDSVNKGSHLHFELRNVQLCGLGLGGRLDPLPFVELVK
jgi:murein DD-endopeptidase MepM/ murein hydrolase activator NlpD